jgi:hypothetical protein
MRSATPSKSFTHINGSHLDAMRNPVEPHRLFSPIEIASRQVDCASGDLRRNRRSALAGATRAAGSIAPRSTALGARERVSVRA